MSYKQQNPAPRYHARDVAVMRAKRAGILCILGSATPAMESLGNARSGKYKLVRMPERIPVPGYSAAPLPRIWLVDMTLERKNNRDIGTMSTRLKDGIRIRLANQEQVILLQNRRGFAPVYQCQDCGFVPECRDCSVSMTYHKVYRELRCHYCGVSRMPLYICTACGSTKFLELGAGTQRIEEELVMHFPGTRILRMDLDSTRRKYAHHDILDAFGRGEADILVGTQMIAKGLDFSRVSLVGVVNSDIGLHLPDFRSEERTFQLLMQVAGRAGRAELRGEVILQTRQPTHMVYEHLIHHDYDRFAAQMLDARALLSYPPYGRIVGLRFKGPDDHRTSELAKTWHTLLTHLLPDTIDTLGPEAAHVPRVKKHYRYNIMLKAPSNYPKLQHNLRAVARQAGRPPEGYTVAVNVDAFSIF